jgi:diacylglycerol kinase (ATP)
MEVADLRQAGGDGGRVMRTIAVVAHAGKGPEGGLRELRRVLAREGVTDPLWYEVAKSRKAPKYARRALAQGAEVLFV